ncbi:MAG: methionine--tRNA ligase subunit beta, partial [Planctomycetota bacterium]
GKLDASGKDLIAGLTEAKDEIVENFENLNYAAAVRIITSLADQTNRYVEQSQPWVTIKTDPEKTRTILTVVINAVRILTIYLKPVLPDYAKKIEKFLNVPPLSFADLQTVLEDHKINKFERLIDRIEKEQVNAMIEESREKKNEQPQQADTFEPIAPECTIEDFQKLDLRIAKVIKAEAVENADKLLHLQLDLGGVERSVFAGIAKAYKPEELTGKIVICLANLKPRKMKFGLSEGMILAAGTGEKDIYILSADDGVRPGQRVS